MPELKNKQYMFTFEGGGWNTVWAKTKEVLSTTTVMSSSTEDIPIMVSDEAKG